MYASDILFLPEQLQHPLHLHAAAALEQQNITGPGLEAQVVNQLVLVVVKVGEFVFHTAGDRAGGHTVGVDAVGKNPWTSKEIKDAEDVEEYLTMKEIDSKGGNPVEDYPEKLKEKNRAAKAANSDGGEKSEESVEAWFREDAKDFSQKHPELTDADRKRLFEDKSFLRYGQGKFGSEPMASIYEGYMALVEGIKAEQAARERRAEANKQSSPGSLKSGTTETPYYTREELQRMSAAEVRRNYDKVMRSMERLPR